MTRSGFTVNIAPRSVRGRPSTRCKWFASASCAGRSCYPALFAIQVLREMGDDMCALLSSVKPLAPSLMVTSSSRIGWSTSAFLSAIEVFPPIRSLSQRAVLLRCAVAFLVLESTTFKSVVGALNTEYVSSRSRLSVALSKFSRQSGTCRGCMETDITSLRQDILIFLLSALPVLSQTSTLRLWIVCSSVSLHCGLQTEFTFVSLSVISSLTTGLCSGTTSATEQHRNVGSKDAQFATHMPSKELQKKRYWQKSTWSTKCLSLVTSCSFPVVHRERSVHSVDVVVTPDA